jgi:periplasmic protein TonB
MTMKRSIVVAALAALAVLAALAAGGSVALASTAPFKDAPAPQRGGAPAPSMAADPAAYKLDAARHIYASYAPRVRKGKLEPLLYGIAIVETELDENGNVVAVNILRPPAAAEVAPWISKMIWSASPLPAPARLGRSKFTEIWLVERAGFFQLDTLSEGQR